MRRSTRPAQPELARKKRAIGYIRVSTHRQAEHEVSLAEQQRRIEEYGSQSEFDVVEYFIDRGLSGRTTNRPQFKAMVAFAKDRNNKIDALICYDSSRLFRNALSMLDVEDGLKDVGVKFLSVKQRFPEGPDGNLLKTISYALDQAQSDRNRAVVIDMMAANAVAGHWNGSAPPFGYRTEVALQTGSKQR
ncbi:MAG: recombinase family protein, partial [Bosea sp. (in: a-proteobacteria)]